MLFQNNNRDVPGAMFFAGYVGPSMNPTLRESEIMEIVPYGSKPLRVGDVAFFLPPQADRPVVHRIVRVCLTGIAMLGDNNTREDDFPVPPKNIQGRVVAAWRGQKRREIAGGLRGRLAVCLLQSRQAIDRGVAPLLRPLYDALSRRGRFARMLPARLRPRVVVFHTRGRDRFHLLLGLRVIGQYDERRQRWQIQRPFRLFVDERLLRRRRDENKTGSFGAIEDRGR